MDPERRASAVALLRVHLDGVHLRVHERLEVRAAPVRVEEHDRIGVRRGLQEAFGAALAAAQDAPQEHAGRRVRTPFAPGQETGSQQDAHRHGGPGAFPSHAALLTLFDVLTKYSPRVGSVKVLRWGIAPVGDAGCSCSPRAPPAARPAIRGREPGAPSTASPAARP